MKKQVVIGIDHFFLAFQDPFDSSIRVIHGCSSQIIKRAALLLITITRPKLFNN
jgi:hypothetical protein